MIERRPLLAGTAALAAWAQVKAVGGTRALAAIPSTNADVPKLNYDPAFSATIRAPRIHWAQSLACYS